jgi:ABC-type transport system substrate-binding protein
MRQIAFLLLALTSFACAAPAATRPHYGGTLRVSMQSAPTNLALPALSAPADYWDMTRVLSLIADTLVKVDAEDRPQPALALTWQSDSSARHWQFTLRHGVTFHDGRPASAPAIAEILSALHPDWNVRALTDSLTIDTETSNPSLLAELALPRNLIITRNANDVPIGTGPFRIVDFQPGKDLKLAASEDSWASRPFIDAVDIEFGKSFSDQTLALELARTDVIEAAPQSANPSAPGHTSTSLPVELMVLVFTPNSKAQSVPLRQALALSINRKPIQSVVLKGAAEPTDALLPNWMTGYSAAFSTQPNVQRAKTLLADSRQPPLTLSYDPRDPHAQLIAERIALNAREAGIAVQVSLSGADDLRLVRIALPTPDPALALREMARQLSLPQPALHGNTAEDLYQAERTLLDGSAVIPLFHLPVASAAGPNVQGWAPDQLGSWNLPDLWLTNAGGASPRSAAVRDFRPGNSR